MPVAVRILIFFALVVVAEFYSFIVIRSAIRHIQPPYRGVIMGSYIVLSIASWVLLVAFRSIDWDNFPMMIRMIIISFLMGFFIGKLLIMMVMLVDEVRRAALYITQKIRPEPIEQELEETMTGTGITRSMFLMRVAMGLGLASIAGFFYGMSNRYKYQVRKVALQFPNLPAAFKGLRVVHISDIHSGSFDNKQKVEKGIRLILAQKPDIIVFTGDLVNNTADEILPFMDTFSKLKAPMGVYSTLGNHDYGDYHEWDSATEKAANLQALKDAHGKMGWRLLMNEHVILERNSERIAVLGVENWSNKLRFPKYGRMQDACKGLVNDEVPFQILLSHDPSHWHSEILDLYKNVDLTLSGHTHGMQFGIDIPGFRVSPVQMEYEHWIDLYQKDNQYLYVNRGFGFLGYPGRVGILPEITVFELS